MQNIINITDDCRIFRIFIYNGIEQNINTIEYLYTIEYLKRNLKSMERFRDIGAVFNETEYVPKTFSPKLLFLKIKDER